MEITLQIIQRGGKKVQEFSQANIHKEIKAETRQDNLQTVGFKEEQETTTSLTNTMNAQKVAEQHKVEPEIVEETNGYIQFYNIHFGEVGQNMKIKEKRCVTKGMLVPWFKLQFF